MTTTMIGIFVLGVLAGWLAEWIFVSFFVKDKNKTEQPKADEVETQGFKKKAIQQPEKKKIEPTDVGKVSGGASKAETTKQEVPVEKKAVETLKATKTEEKPAKAKEKLEASAKKEKAAKSKSKPAKDNKVNKSTKQKPKKTKANTAKTTPMVNEDFTQLKGIGPKLSESIKMAKINSFADLAKLSGDELLEKLEKAGANIVNRPAFFNIPKQAALAAKGDWDGLETLKKSI